MDVLSNYRTPFHWRRSRYPPPPPTPSQPVRSPNPYLLTCCPNLRSACCRCWLPGSFSESIMTSAMPAVRGLSAVFNAGLG